MAEISNNVNINLNICIARIRQLIIAFYSCSVQVYLIKYIQFGAIAQLVEQRPEEPCVPGSSPGGATTVEIKSRFPLSERIF
jgi:hypothetical protein